MSIDVIESDFEVEYYLDDSQDIMAGELGFIPCPECEAPLDVNCIEYGRGIEGDDRKFDLELQCVRCAKQFIVNGRIKEYVEK